MKKFMVLFILSIFLVGCLREAPKDDVDYLLHENISTTIFWVGESATEENRFISNFPSAWDDGWLEHYGGIDAPDDREGYLPINFTPYENLFYFALPYNDFEEGKRKIEATNSVYWSREKEWGELESMLKNRWIKIIKNNKVTYAQWEDVGPFGEDDVDYVFGNSLPKNKINNNAGLDVSPAVRDYLDLKDIDTVSWQFVDFEEIPDGPWKEVITTSQINWK